MTRFARVSVGLAGALLATAYGQQADAYYKTITITGYYSIAVDGGYVWGGLSQWSEGWVLPAPKASVWRYNPSDGSSQIWALPDESGVSGPVAGIVPLANKVLFLISGHKAAGSNPRPNPPDATYAGAADHSVDGGIVTYDRGSGTFTLLDVPVYDIEGYQLLGNDLWLTCGDADNPRNVRGYRYNVTTGDLALVSGLSDSHAIAIDTANDRGFTGTHHGRGLEHFQLSTMSYTGSTYGDAPTTPVTEQVIDTSAPAPAAPGVKVLSRPYLSLVKAMLIVDDQLWVNEPMGAWYAGWFGGVVMLDRTTLATKWATPTTWQYRDLGDETALDLELDPNDNTTLWASGAKGLFKVHRTESPPRIEQVDMDGVLDHNLQHIAIDASYLWAGTEQGYLYRYDRVADQWAYAGKFDSDARTFTGMVPAVVASRQVPGTVQSPAATVSGGDVSVTWTASANAHSYFVARDGVLVGMSATTSHTDKNAPPGAHTYGVMPNDGPHLKGGLFGPSASASSVTVAGAPPVPPDCATRPSTIAWGLGSMSYIPMIDLYADLYEFPNTKGVYPFTNVTQPQAKQIASWQGKRLPTHDEYTVIVGKDLADGGVDWPDWNDANAFWDYNHFRARRFEPAGTLDNSVGWGLYDVPGNVMEWLDEYSPLGDGHTYGLAAGGSYPEVAFGWRIYAPYAEYPAGSWARNIDKYNHSEIGFRCVMSGSQALHMLNPSCASDAGPPTPPPVPDAAAPSDGGSGGAGGAGGAADASAGAAGKDSSGQSPSEDSGCGCRVAPPIRTWASWDVVLLAGLAIARRRARAKRE